MEGVETPAKNQKRKIGGWVGKGAGPPTQSPGGQIKGNSLEPADGLEGAKKGGECSACLAGGKPVSSLGRKTQKKGGGGVVGPGRGRNGRGACKKPVKGRRPLTSVAAGDIGEKKLRQKELVKTY